jgi:hypothetical protein
MEIQYSELGRIAAIWSTRGDANAKACFGFAAPLLRIDLQDRDQQQQTLRTVYAGIGWEVPRLLEMMPAASDWYFDAAAQIDMPRWSQGRVALVGDAAYCASPMSGQGTSIALIGAYVLAGELAAASGDHPRAFAEFENLMRPFVEANQALGLPDSLKFEADQLFFERRLDGVDVVVHGRHSHERQPRSYLRRRLVLTRRVPAIAVDPSNEKALFWNPAGASFELALAVLGTPDGSIGVIGGTGVFGMFLDRYDVFHLSRAPDVRLPGGRPVFPEVPTRTPEEVLASHGLDRGQRQVLDPAKGLVIVSWQRSSKPD